MTAINWTLPRDPNQRAKSIADIAAAISEGAKPETSGESARMSAWPCTPGE